MIDLAELKSNGFLAQKQKGYYIVRFRAIAGNFTTEQLTKATALADEYGKGYVHFTTRQGMEIPWIPLENCPAVLQEARQAGLLPGADGAKIRTIVACPGKEVCRWGIMDSRRLATALDERFFGRVVPKKTKMAVSGCPNSCSKPIENDIGFMGAAQPGLNQDLCTGCGACAKLCNAKAIHMVDQRPVINTEKCIQCGKCIVSCPTKAWEQERKGYHILIGGKIGRFPRLGNIVARFVDEEEVEKYTENLLAIFAELAQPGERMANVVERLGVEVFKERLEKMI